MATEWITLDGSRGPIDGRDGPAFAIGDEVWNNAHAKHGTVVLLGNETATEPGGVLVQWLDLDLGVELWEMPEDLNLCAQGKPTQHDHYDDDPLGVLPPATHAPEDELIGGYRRFDIDGHEMHVRPARVHQEPYAEIVIEGRTHKLDRDTARALGFALTAWAKEAS